MGGVECGRVQGNGWSGMGLSGVERSECSGMEWNIME